MTSEFVCDSMAQRLCGLARQYAFLCAEEFIDTKHLLLAAVEVTPVEWHGCERLTERRVLDAMPGIDAVNSELSDSRPCRLSPAANDVLGIAAGMASRSGRAISCQDIWIALLEDRRGTCSSLMKRLGIDPLELQKRFRGTPPNMA